MNPINTITWHLPDFATKVCFLGKGKDEGGVGFVEEEEQLQEKYESYTHDYMACA